jgi:hypothetical protein
MEIEGSHPTLELLPTNTDQNLPTVTGRINIVLLAELWS